MVVSSRLSATQLVVECDGAQYHSFLLLNDFRDDIIEEQGWPICRIRGSAIVGEPDRCAVTVVRRWFPELTSSFAYWEVLEELRKRDDYSGDTQTYHDGSWFVTHVDYRPIYDEGRSNRDMVREAFCGRWRTLGDLARAHIELFHPQPERRLNELRDFLAQRPVE
jgi:hypothetical protein